MYFGQKNPVTVFPHENAMAQTNYSAYPYGDKDVRAEAYAQSLHGDARTVHLRLSLQFSPPCIQVC